VSTRVFNSIVVAQYDDVGKPRNTCGGVQRSVAEFHTDRGLKMSRVREPHGGIILLKLANVMVMWEIPSRPKGCLLYNSIALRNCTVF